MAAKRSGRRSSGGNGNGRRGAQRTGGVPEEVRRAILEGPPRTMLVTAREDRTQIAVLEDRTVVEHYVTRKKDVTYVGNIYMARVQNVLPGMEAAFLDIGKGRNGVLYAGEVLYDELDLEEGEAHRIENALKPGQTVLVQVTKDPMGSKGPRLTMHLSLAGRYMVLAPNSDLFGISRKLTDKERDRLRRVVKKVKPEQHGIIVRTAAEGASEDQITADIERLLAKWARVEEAAADAKALTAVYEEPPLVVKVIRDNFGPEFERAIVDEEDLYRQVRGYLAEVAPELLDKVELYGAPTSDARARAAGAPALEPGTPTSEPGAQPSPVGREEEHPGEGGADAERSDEVAAAATDGAAEAADPLVGSVDLAAAAARRTELPALFEAYDVADQLRKAMGRKVWLPSGGYLIIESTEAMKVIDVNTGRFTGGKDTNLEEIVLRTNLEAADEIVRQLRLRDMGGIIVIDFIDMLLKANQEQVVRRLKRELLRDRTKTRVSEVSRLGLVQMTRKNVSQGLIESFSHPCEACEGRGVISELE
ncbi:MAG: ribonuclease E/G, partial [Nitriliruptoraceae bacterium]